MPKSGQVGQSTIFCIKPFGSVEMPRRDTVLRRVAASSQTWLRDLAGGCRRHCEPTGRAIARPMTGSANQSMAHQGSKRRLLRSARNTFEAHFLDLPAPVL